MTVMRMTHRTINIVLGASHDADGVRPRCIERSDTPSDAGPGEHRNSRLPRY
jgi:hypothetical protein